MDAAAHVGLYPTHHHHVLPRDQVRKDHTNAHPNPYLSPDVAVVGSPLEDRELLSLLLLPVLPALPVLPVLPVLLPRRPRGGRNHAC